jgi:hypothetical protein
VDKVPGPWQLAAPDLELTRRARDGLSFFFGDAGRRTRRNMGGYRVWEAFAPMGYARSSARVRARNQVRIEHQRADLALTFEQVIAQSKQ